MNGGNFQLRDGSILVVCTGNVCRSPYIERLLVSHLVGTDITVTSAGTDARNGAPMEPPVAQRLTMLGADPSGFQSRQLTEDLATSADLVLCATREHRKLVVRMAPRVLRRTYALADFSDLARRLVSTGMPLRGIGGSFVRTAATSVERVRDEVQARAAHDAEIVDPFRQHERVYEHMFAQADGLLPPIVAILTGSTRGASVAT